MKTAVVPMLYRVVATVDMGSPAGMVLIPAGDFIMGLEGHSWGEPLHPNTISGFYMDHFEGTKALGDENARGRCLWLGHQ